MIFKLSKTASLEIILSWMLFGTVILVFKPGTNLMAYIVNQPKAQTDVLDGLLNNGPTITMNGQNVKVVDKSGKHSHQSSTCR